MESLEAVRMLALDKVGSSGLLAERPGKRMAKHKSRALSSSLSQRLLFVTLCLMLKPVHSHQTNAVCIVREAGAIL